MTTTGPVDITARGGQTWPVGPLTVNDGQTTILPMPFGTASVVACDVVNLSGLALLVSAGSGSGVWSMPGGEVTLPVGGQPVQVRAQAVAGGSVTGQVVATYLDAEALAAYSMSPGQLAVVNSSGTVTISGPVTIAGTVPVNVQANQSQFLATVPAGGGPSSQVVTLPPFTASLGLFWQPATPLTSGTFTVTGNTSGLVYWSSQGLAQGVYVSPVFFDVIPQLDTQVTLAWSAGLANPVSVVAYASTDFAHGASDPLAVALTDPTPKQTHQAFGATVPAATTTPVLPAPAAGRVWDLRAASVFAATATASSAQNVGLAGTTTAQFLLGAYASASGVWLNQSYYDTFLSEGLSGHNTTTVGAGMTVWARQVPLAANLL